MRLFKFLFLVGILTAVALIYVQLQVQIYEYAYQGKRKESTLKELLDRQQHIMYNINNLESVQNIGTRLLSEKDYLQFAGKEQVVKINAPIQLVRETNSAEEIFAGRRGGFLASIFTLRSQAEAKPLK